MYTIKKSFGDVDEPETAVVEVIGTYESLDEACEAAEEEFAAIMERLGDAYDDCDGVRFDDIERGCGDYYVTYGCYDCELGCVLREYYYRVYVIETMR